MHAMHFHCSENFRLFYPNGQLDSKEIHVLKEPTVILPPTRCNKISAMMISWFRADWKYTSYARGCSTNNIVIDD